MSKHTKGHFEVHQGEDYIHVYGGDYNHSGNPLASFARIEDAHLFAAAPELLKAAKRSQCNCSPLDRDSGHQVGCWMPALANAITKAEGGAE